MKNKIFSEQLNGIDVKEVTSLSLEPNEAGDPCVAIEIKGEETIYFPVIDGFNIHCVNEWFEDICASETFISADDVIEKEYCEYQHSVLEDAISILPDRQAEIIQSKYWDGLTQKQIAEHQYCSESCIGEYERKALSRLRKMKRIQMLHDELYGYDSNFAYKMSLKKALDNHTSTTEYLALNRLDFEENQKVVCGELKELYKN